MILSIDVGIRNLAMCLIDDKSNIVQEWDVSGVPPEHKDGLYISLRDHLDARPWVLTANTILIEKQPDRNKKMISVMHFLHSYFIIRCPKAETILYDARHKIPDVAGPGKAQYNKRKKVAIERCEAFIRDGPTNAHWLETFQKSKKKDDLADTVMQALSFINRKEIVPASKKKKSTKLIARKPNENQKMTKYSKCNLAWIYLNKVECEVLENNKRFMKDLKRYYKDINEMIKDLK
jgi:phosphoenolpyruvate synthase/pyruvate phosphate dikinase|tara:strand:- start:574 stop:1278 length:705 start_codon:yes stop_codon:yes gene_type:complete